MKWQLVFLLLMGMKWQYVYSTCVFASDTGFTLDCGFKKSSLFRVRNLGGIKSYLGLGISLGDHLGFKEALSDSNNTNRRSVHLARSTGRYFQPLLTVSATPVSSSQDVENKYNALTVQHIDPLDVSTLLSQLQAVVPTSVSVLSPANSLLPEVVGHTLKSVAGVTDISDNALLPSINQPWQQVLYQQQKQLAGLSSATISTRTTPPPHTPPPVMPLLTTITNPTFVPGTISKSVSTLDPSFLPSQPQPQQQLFPTAETSLDYRNMIPGPTIMPLQQKYASTNTHKVMNAPKEYYPINYNKNFDDNFTSRIELPNTLFSCGDQKHFPGIYGDEDLNCMVFHVCALTDDGLVMKSFLCPESTLFDQTILKCNWWFYVDCKASKKLYDSNIPISKSYQLMKALTFFLSYGKKNDKPQMY